MSAETPAEDRNVQRATKLDTTSISDALDELALVEPELAELVDLKFFCGFSFAEIASLRKLSERTVQRKVGKGAHRSPSEYSRGFVSIRN